MTEHENLLSDLSRTDLFAVRRVTPGELRSPVTRVSHSDSKQQPARAHTGKNLCQVQAGNGSRNFPIAVTQNGVTI